MTRMRSSFTLAVLLGLAGVMIAADQPAAQAPCRDYARVECEAMIAGPLEAVWQCWTTSEGAQSFFAPKAIIEPHPGGSYEIWFKPGNPPGTRGEEGHKVLSLLPGEMLSFEWGAPPQFAFARQHPGWVVVTFDTVDAAHTRVRLVHLGFDRLKAAHPDHASEFDQVKSFFDDAWPGVLALLKRRFEEGPRWDADGKMLWK